MFKDAYSHSADQKKLEYDRTLSMLVSWRRSEKKFVAFTPR